MPMLFFYFLKIIFNISTSKRSKKYKLHSILAKKKISKFDETQLQTQCQTVTYIVPCFHWDDLFCSYRRSEKWTFLGEIGFFFFGYFDLHALIFFLWLSLLLILNDVFVFQALSRCLVFLVFSRNYCSRFGWFLILNQIEPDYQQP